MLKSVWSWLSNKKHNINNSHMQELDFLFKNVLYSIDEASLYKSSSVFLNKANKFGY